MNTSFDHQNTSRGNSAPFSTAPWMLIALSLLIVGLASIFLFDPPPSGYSELKQIAPSGGRYFTHEVRLRVPPYAQADTRWGGDPLGNTPASMAEEGCAVSAAAMVLGAFGFDTDPGRLNKKLTANKGFTENGWIIWEAVAATTGGKIHKAYEDLPSFKILDEELRTGNPVIARLRTSGGTTHFVVLAGKRGFDYLCLDPGAGATKGLYPLKEFGSKIEAIRFFRPN
jgi:hypothetical protein